MLRNNGFENDIDSLLAGTESEGMTTNDFLSYVGDFPAGYIQYGDSEGFCNLLELYQDESDAVLFNSIIAGQFKLGDTPADYDTRPGTKIHSTVIDGEYSGRTWTYQFCTEFGFFQTASKLHRVRSPFIDNQYWRDQCQDVFPELDMSKYPDIAHTLAEYGNGNEIDMSNIFFTNGSQDPWKWVTQLKNRPEINQVSKVSDCNGCAHCADLYTPAESDPESLKETRQMMYDWLTEILDKKEESFMN